MTLRECLIGAICTAPINPNSKNLDVPGYIAKQVENLLEERFLEYLRLNKDSKEVLEALYQRLTGKELTCLK